MRLTVYDDFELRAHAALFEQGLQLWPAFQAVTIGGIDRIEPIEVNRGGNATAAFRRRLKPGVLGRRTGIQNTALGVVNRIQHIMLVGDDSGITPQADCRWPGRTDRLLHRPALAPGNQPAVEQRHLPMPDRFQHPQQPGRFLALNAVVGNNPPVRIQPDPAQQALQSVAGGQQPRSGRQAEVELRGIDKLCAGDMRLPIILGTADVQQQDAVPFQAGRLGKQRLQRFAFEQIRKRFFGHVIR